MKSLTVAQKSLLPQDVLQLSLSRPVLDPEVFNELAHQLNDAAVRLLDLSEDPIVIASSPNRFNDIFWSDWRAIRFGSFFTERHDYIRRDYEGELAAGPEGARKARDILEGLERIGWRNLFSDAFGIVWDDQILAIVIQSHIPWLVFCSCNNTEDESVFALWDETPLVYFGECVPRFDWRMQDPIPLEFKKAVDAGSI